MLPALISASLFGADALNSSSPVVISATVQTGFADTFQLTLGGVFGAGPAWQNRIGINAANVFRAGDAITLAGFSTMDVHRNRHDWSASLGYKARVWRSGSQQLSLGASVERWRFPSVLSGSQDWVLGGSATYARTIYRLPFTVQSNSWSLLHSPLPKGSLLHTTGWLAHPLRESRGLSITLRHGPQHTYSWGYYGTHQNRVLRYAGTITIARGRTSLELGYRQQVGLQPRIPDNRFWHAILSQTF